MTAKFGAGWSDIDPNRIDENGAVKSLQSGESAYLPLSVPASSDTGVTIRCTYAGTGTLSVQGDVTNVRPSGKSFEFKMLNRFPNPARPYLALTATNPSDPVRQIDCRESDAPTNKLFADEFLQSLAPFGTIRFLDWQNINQNKGGSWARRSRPGSFVINPIEGASVEHMTALVRQLNADAWFLMPYNADQEYITRFAQYVHDNLPAGRKVYVELSNEVWNYGFPVTHQAIAEGEAAGLGSGWGAGLNRYSQKSAWMLKIWTSVFADRPKDLVRVVSTLHSNTVSSNMVLAFGDTAKFVDALATAPYFGADLFNNVPANASTNELMLALGLLADKEIATSLQNKAIAKNYGIRHITYEAGQHVVTGDLAKLTAISRNPKMYDIYKRYLDGWMNQQGDLMTLYHSTGSISQYGAWGLREYSGQPLSETPKRRAALEAAAKR